MKSKLYISLIILAPGFFLLPVVRHLKRIEYRQGLSLNLLLLQTRQRLLYSQ
jgi:hypothetical protein